MIHDPDSNAAGHVFFPLRYVFGRKLPQYLCAAHCDHLVQFDPRDTWPEAPERAFAVVVRSRHASAANLVRLPTGEPSAAPHLAATQLLLRQGWQPISRETFQATVTGEVEVLRSPN